MHHALAGQDPGGPRLRRARHGDGPAADARRTDRRQAARRTRSTARTSGRCCPGEAGAKSPHEAFCYYSGDELQAVRSGDWKLHLPHEYLTVAGEPGTDGKPANFDNMKPESIEAVRHPGHRQPARLPGRADRPGALQPQGRHRRDEERRRATSRRGSHGWRHWRRRCADLGDYVYDLLVVETSAQGQGIDLLVGRDVLMHGVLVYLGTENQFTLGF